MGRKPTAKGLAWLAPEPVESGAYLPRCRAFAQENEVLRELVQLGPPRVQIRCAPTQRLLCDWFRAQWRNEWINNPLDQVLREPAALVQLSKHCLHTVRERTSFP